MGYGKFVLFWVGMIRQFGSFVKACGIKAKWGQIIKGFWPPQNCLEVADKLFFNLNISHTWILLLPESYVNKLGVSQFKMSRVSDNSSFSGLGQILLILIFKILL